MENKHFSHPHNLTCTQIPENSQTNCFGCKFPNSGTVFVCQECKFFLHEQCFHATRSVDHPSHPLHPLNLVPYPTYPSSSFICNSCNRPGSGFSYTCSKCDFDLHVHCTNSNPKSKPNSSCPPSSHPQPNQIPHKSHPEHPLTHLPSPPYEGGMFNCNACKEDGNASVFHCKICQFDLHEKCAALPETLKRKDHDHELTLHYSVQGIDGFPSSYCTCDVCFRKVPEDSWTYYCAECDYETHVNCVKAKARLKEEVVLEQHLAAQAELINIQNRVRLNAMKNDIIASAFYGPRRYYY